jgi:hypothetical protein
MHKGDYPSALGLFLESLEQDADFPCPHRALSLIYRLQGRKERARNALRLGQGQGNPMCVADNQLLALRVDMDAMVARALHSDLIQGRTAMRNGVHYLFAGENEMTNRTLRTGFSGSPTVQADVTPAGWVWGADHSGLPGMADPSTRGGLPGSGVSPPDAATSGAGGAGRD